MTPTSDIAFWEVVKDKVLHSRLHDLLTRLAIFGDGLTLLISRWLLLLLVFICFFAFSRVGHPEEARTATRVALQALAAVLVPTCSLWPNRYIKLAKSTLRSQINIPLEVIIEDTIDGVIELRNPNNDLANLVGSGATVNGHTICITPGWKWWIKYFKWWMPAEENTRIGQSKPGSMLGLFGLLHRNTHASTSRLNLSSSPHFLTLHPLLCLDCLPRGAIPTLNVGGKATLEFTALSSSLQALSTAQIVSAIPFMISERPRRWPRTPVSVLKQLNASYGSKMVIDSLSNVSADYARALGNLYNSLSGEQKFCEAWVSPKAWRRELFLVALEAALVRRGWIERWALQVTVQ